MEWGALGKRVGRAHDLSRGGLRAVLAGLLVLLFAAFPAAAQSASEPRHILVLQSLDRGSLIFDGITASFRAELQERVGARVTPFEFVVTPAGLTETPERSMITFLQSLYADRPPALIVTIGGPATAFARKYRQDLFPQVPLLFAAVEKRFLGNAPLGENETSVAVSIDYPGVLDDILQVLPDTRTVLMVIGAGPLGNFWQTELQKNFEPYRDRLTFLWSKDLSYEQLLQRAASLPPHSAIFYITAGTFAAGSWQSAQRALADLATGANAPRFGALSPWLGAGIVGGRLLHIEELGATVADVAVRILDGESPSRITVPLLARGRAAFDARELQRWDIPEARLPPGSDVRFAGPSLWHDYRREVLVALGVLVLQSLLVIALLYQRGARRRAEADGRSHLALAADANRRVTMTALTGSIAHELGQPLNAILHNAQAAEMLVASGRATPETLRAILADIQTADLRATQIIERHRTMLRAHQLDRKPIDVHAVVRESVALIADHTKAKQVQVDIGLPPDPCIVVGDPVLLQQIVINLMMNAMDAMAEIPAERRRITVHSDVTPGSVEVSVRDTGTGLPASLDGKLFEAFVTTKTNGLGIGLTIARTIVEVHSGRIDAHNNIDGGATFTVTLPCNEIPVTR
jgi:signal transduction histidine kinase